MSPREHGKTSTGEAFLFFQAQNGPQVTRVARCHPPVNLSEILLVLAAAHRDHQLENKRLRSLAVLCQRCNVPGRAFVGQARSGTCSRKLSSCATKST
jgi:hypothetical protein